MVAATEVAGNIATSVTDAAASVQEAGAHVVDSVRTSLDGSLDAVRSSLDGQFDTVRSVLDDQVDTVRSSLDDRIAAWASGAHQTADVLRTTGTQIGHTADHGAGIGADGLADEVQRFARRRPWSFAAICIGGTLAAVVVFKVRAAAKAKVIATAEAAGRVASGPRLGEAKAEQPQVDGPLLAESDDLTPPPYLGADAGVGRLANATAPGRIG